MLIINVFPKFQLHVIKLPLQIFKNKYKKYFNTNRLDDVQILSQFLLHANIIIVFNNTGKLGDIMTETISKGIDFKKIDEILQSYDYNKSYLIAMLQKVQEVYRYLPEEAMTYIGEHIDGLSPATVYGVATFYAQFSLEPKGKYEIRVCDGTACHVRGSMPVLNAIKNKLKLKEGQTTCDNGLFSLEIVSCLGACGLAPVCMINDKVYPQMTSDAISVILDTLMKEEGVA